MIGISFSNLEDSVIAIETNAKALDFLSIDGLELQVELVSGSLIWNTLKWSPLHVCGIIISHILKFHLGHDLII